MLATRKLRLALVASAAWLLAAFLLDLRSLSEYVGAVLIGWIAIWLAIYGAFWVIDAPANPIKVKLPRWAGYVLIAIMVILIMGLPKVLFR